MAGQTFGRLYVIGLAAGKKNGCVLWQCKCDCGKEIILRGAVIRRAMRHGIVASCGCWGSENRLKKSLRHGMSYTRIHRTWAAMLTRCGNPNSDAYKNYGGRGITVCERWKNFKNFFTDMGNPPSELHEIDRINTNSHYEPGNCRWATVFQNSINRRDSIVWVIDGVGYEAATVAARSHNVSAATIHRWCGRKKGFPAKANCWAQKKYSCSI